MTKEQLLARFSALVFSFKAEDYANPVTYKSIEDAVRNIKKELSKVI